MSSLTGYEYLFLRLGKPTKKRILPRFKSIFRRPTELHEWDNMSVLQLCDPSNQTLLKGMNFHDMEWCTINISFHTKWLPVLHVFSYYYYHLKFSFCIITVKKVNLMWHHTFDYTMQEMSPSYNILYMVW